MELLVDAQCIERSQKLYNFIIPSQYSVCFGLVHLSFGFPLKQGKIVGSSQSKVHSLTGSIFITSLHHQFITWAYLLNPPFIRIFNYKVVQI